MGRFSLLFLYNRIFKPDQSFHVAVRVVGVLNGLWYAGSTIILGVRCVPVKLSRSPFIEGQCFNIIPLINAFSILDSLLDFTVMILPISVLRKVQMSLQRKINAAMIFAIGDL